MTTEIKNVRVFENGGLTESKSVYIAGGKISSALTADEVIDGTGKVLLPGLIDAHMHTTDPRDLVKLAQFGVTSGMDMTCGAVEFYQAVKNIPDGAQIQSAIIAAVAPDGNHAKIPGYRKDAIIHSVEEAQHFVAARVAENADYIKIVTEAEPPAGMTLDEIKTIVESSHLAGKKVHAHAITSGAYALCVSAGVDFIEHIALDKVLDDSLIAEIKAKNIIVTPTLIMMQGTCQLRHLDFSIALENVRKLHEAGVKILVGTDANSAPGVPFSPEHGISMHQEFLLLEQAGLFASEILLAATINASTAFRLENRGKIEIGKQADLVLISGNPLEDIARTANIEGVWLKGKRIR